MIPLVVGALGVAGKMASGIMSARARRSEFAQQLRALEVKRDQTVGIARARSAAMGVEAGSLSTENYLAQLAGGFEDEMRNVRKARRQTYGLGMLGALLGGVQGAAGVASAYGRATGGPGDADSAAPTYTFNGTGMWR
jgi:hypothetical protein